MSGGVGNSSDVNAALVAQAARGPSSGEAPASPFSAAPAADQTRTMAMMGANPYRQASPAASSQVPTLMAPGFQGIQNPFYAPPGMRASPMSQVSDLGEQYKTYAQSYGDRLSQSQQANQAQLAAMQQAYQDAQAAKRAQAEAAAAEARRMEMMAQQSQGSSDGNPNVSMASGGIASLQRGFK